jgi:NTE family protein
MFKTGNRKEPPKIGLALSGGAARGFAHIGVIKTLQQHEVPIHCVAGTSAGAVVGALYCGGYDWRRMLEVAEHLRWRELISLNFSGLGVVSAEKLENLVRELLGDIDFSELHVPFRAIAVDIARGEEVHFSTGSVAEAVRASTSVPGIFQPLVEGETALVDGGVMNNLPTEVVRDMGAEKVIAVDLNAHRPQNEMPVSLLDVSFRSFAMLLDCTSAEGREDADLLIQPDLTDFNYHDLSRAHELVARGEEAAAAQLAAIRAL